MKFGVLCIMIAVLENARSALSPAGENVCLVDEKYTAFVQVQEMVPVTIYKVEWCLKIPPRCTKETHTYKPTIVNKRIPRIRIVPKCCQGYKEIPEQNRCVPYCSEPCLNGDCILPDTCSCISGYHGIRCDKPCLPGTWGRGCLEKCDCSGNGECEGVNGICTCSAGWKGYRCEIPCDPGQYGTNCEGRCNCDWELCNHVSGECEAITDTTLATVDNATTEGNVFETTTDEITDMTDATEIVTGYTVPDVTELISGAEVSDDERIVTDNVTHPTEIIVEVDNTTPVVENTVSRGSGEVREYVESKTPTLQKTYPEWVNETDNGNEIDSTINYSAGVQKTKFNLLNLLGNLSIVCGVFVLIFVLTMCVVLISHHRKVKKIENECQKDSSMNSQDLVIHRFYGGCITPAKTILDNQVTPANLDLDVELPKLMTFKPLPDEKSDKEYFMRTNESQEDNFIVANDNPLRESILNDDYNNRLTQFEYDVPKSTTFVPARFEYG